LAHSIKGTSATLGADRLAALASDLENLLRASVKERIRADDIRVETEAISHELIALAAALPPQPISLQTVNTMLQSQESLKAIINELDTLLAQSDTAVIALFEKHAASLQPILGSSYESFAQQIEQFQFEAARITLRNIG